MSADGPLFLHAVGFDGSILISGLANVDKDIGDLAHETSEVLARRNSTFDGDEVVRQLESSNEAAYFNFIREEDSIQLTGHTRFIRSGEDVYQLNLTQRTDAGPTEVDRFRRILSSFTLKSDT